MAEKGPNWKDDLLIRAAAAMTEREIEAGGRLAQEVRAENEKATNALREFVQRAEPGTYALMVSMEEYLKLRGTSDAAVHEALYFGKAAELWCKRAQEYCKWRNRLLWMLALALGWALGATWILWKS